MARKLKKPSTKPIKMKTTLITLLAATATTIATAQKPEEALIRVKYDFSHMTDTNKREDFYKETMMVVAGKNASVFLSYDTILGDIDLMADMERQNREQAGAATPIFRMPPRKKPANRTAFYYYANEQKLFVQEHLGAFYLVERDADKIDWKITAETRDIESIKCKKATAYYRGRNWIAWFSEDIPFSTGPWLLVGLPGLVVQANDDKNEVMFEFAGLEKVDKNKKTTIKGVLDGNIVRYHGSTKILAENIIELPAKAIRATPNEVKRLKEFMRDDPQGFAKAQLAAVGLGGLKPVSVAPRTSTPAPAPKVNNPIDKSKQ